MKNIENEMKLEFLSKSSNEAFARITVAAFASQLDPSLEELADIKTAVSEAVTNSIIHGYENKIGIVKLEAKLIENQIIIEIFSAIFRIEGIQLDKARFQIISIITGTGFTTSESELMLATKRRRKLTQIMILFSYIFNISIVTTIVNIFISYNNTTLLEFEIGAGLTAINIVLLISLNKSTRIRKTFDNIVKKIATKTEKRRINPVSVYDYYGNKVIAEITINNLNNKIKQLSLEKLKREFDIQLLVVKRGNSVISELNPNLKIEDNDILLVFGNLKKIKGLFKKKK